MSRSKANLILLLAGAIWGMGIGSYDVSWASRAEDANGEDSGAIYLFLGAHLF